MSKQSQSTYLCFNLHLICDTCGQALMFAALLPQGLCFIFQRLLNLPQFTLNNVQCEENRIKLENHILISKEKYIHKFDRFTTKVCNCLTVFVYHLHIIGHIFFMSSFGDLCMPRKYVQIILKIVQQHTPFP